MKSVTCPTVATDVYTICRKAHSYTSFDAQSLCLRWTCADVDILHLYKLDMAERVTAAGC